MNERQRGLLASLVGEDGGMRDSDLRGQLHLTNNQQLAGLVGGYLSG